MSTHETFSTLIFQHIPKTAGSTLHPIIQRYFRKSQTENVFASSLDDKALNPIRSRSDSEKRSLRLIKGHLPFGVHSLLPQRSKYIAVLRDPVKRVISNFNYILLNRHNPFHQIVMENGWSAGEFITSGIAPGMDNGQVRWITNNIRGLGFGECARQHLDEALENIRRHYLIVGLTEDFDRSLLIMQSLLDWEKWPYYSRRNRNKSRESKTALDKQDLTVIEQHNQLDLELYKEATKSLNEMSGRVPDLQSRLDQFSRRNPVLGRITSILDRASLLNV